VFDKIYFKRSILCMKKLKTFAITVIVAINIFSLTVPLIRANACFGTHHSSMHFFEKGYSQNSHFTTYQVNQGTAVAEVNVFGVGRDAVMMFNGRPATASISAERSTPHTHNHRPG
jgi:hypothetical protein